jgi:hypothetical protein
VLPDTCAIFSVGIKTGSIPVAGREMALYGRSDEEVAVFWRFQEFEMQH